jgi:GTP-binding protein EngB required for normal cell division
LKIDSVEFVRSAAGAGDLPDAGLPEFSMVGRSNVGKSTLINALVKRPIARTSAAPGKTRLINLYRIITPQTGPFYLVDLPGYGYSRKEARAEFDRLAEVYFARAAATRLAHGGPGPQRGSPQGVPLARVKASGVRRTEVLRHDPAADAGHRTQVAQGFSPVIRPTPIGVLLALDARHPGMASDLATLQWLRDRRFDPLVVVTKIDKLSRNERAKALDRFEQLSGQPALAVSAATGEGLEDLWKQMVSWVASMAAGSRPRSRP